MAKYRKPVTVASARAHLPAFGTRPIRSDFYASTQARGSPVKVNRGRWAIRSVPNAIMHMQLDTYQARLCEVWDETTGELHAQIKRSVNGDLTIHYGRKVVDDQQQQ